ncbi:glucan biosynthesis protein [Pseudodonghicola flavimaris]|uniref:Glucan biosynthesis protein n=1 Tax=Pseudodonghicola flavimaris TaxID=3050036 RepID=A0ABT7F8J9_9RHOB|nr:glucan biosynthesis protein [Pseudodonghicola flavimaris]MDK3020810.1 glucan biosynthesis protein [Pseudodonghicola flavimaris]
MPLPLAGSPWSASTISVDRRRLLGGLSATALMIGAGPGRGLAQDTSAAAEPATEPDAQAPAEAPVPFSFDTLSARMQARAETADAPAELSDAFLSGLGYDDYQKIQFDPERARWQGESAGLFRVAAFHLGWLFKTPVQMFELVGGQPQPMRFDVKDFLYHGDLAARVPEGEHLPGVAGFRLSTPLNRADVFDELVAFLGASYFRALGRDTVYGLSARGLAVNTGISGSEEFPRFTEFYLERPAAGATEVTLYAALESPSLTGAYRFVITPGAETEMEVTARLFLRDDIEQLGVAPLTSMYLHGASDPGDFEDYRPQVHDSEGLGLVDAAGAPHWRPLRNPPDLASSYFVSNSPQSFGLYQRDRDWDNYLDAGAQYQRRPSLRVEPLGDWGEGMVRLVEIPSELETNDNIVAFWVPKAPARAGDALSYSYRLTWGMLPPDREATLAWVERTRTGHGGVSGMKAQDDSRKFVIDFAGGVLGSLPPEAELTPVITASKGKIVQHSLSKIPGRDGWRLVFDITAPRATIVEMSAIIEGYGRTLTENWLYQWIKP